MSTARYPRAVSSQARRPERGARSTKMQRFLPLSRGVARGAPQDTGAAVSGPDPLEYGGQFLSKKESVRAHSMKSAGPAGVTSFASTRPICDRVL